MDTHRKCTICKTHHGKRYCLRTNKHICWKCCNESRIDYKCPPECEYRVAEQKNLSNWQIKTDCLSEFHDFLDKHTKAWIAKKSSFFDDEVPLLLKKTAEGKKLLESRLGRLDLDKTMAYYYEKHLEIDIDSKNKPYTRSFEDTVKEFIETIGEGRWDNVSVFLYAPQDTTRQKIVERLKKRKEMQHLDYYMVMASGISTDATEAFSSIEINHDLDMSIILKQIGEDWRIENIIFGEINLIYSETDSAKHITFALSKSDFSRAYQLLKQAEAIYYLSPDIQYYWGLYYSLQNKNKEALSAFVESSTLDPTFIDPIYYQALIHYSDKNITTAKDLFSKAVQIDDKHISSLNFLGIISIEEKNIAQAKNYFEKCLQIDEKNVNALYNLGNIYAVEKDLETACKYFQKCLEIQPDFQLAQQGLEKCKV